MRIGLPHHESPRNIQEIGSLFALEEILIFRHNQRESEREEMVMIFLVSFLFFPYFVIMNECEKTSIFLAGSIFIFIFSLCLCFYTIYTRSRFWSNDGPPSPPYDIFARKFDPGQKKKRIMKISFFLGV
ncbi:hypothetical protein F4809DRAFT_234537 [Biscogniauxia mediterranea]|nr:hypothetical protein F4809DRAFT_234537 [Biscogniauxia mediterranea]